MFARLKSVFEKFVAKSSVHSLPLVESSLVEPFLGMCKTFR